MIEQELDPRIVTIGIEVNGRLQEYTGLQLTARGVKYANVNQNECEISITNLDKATLNYILSETSPFNLNRTPKIATVKAGRQSYGTSLIYKGNIVSAKLSQPPDVKLTLRCLTGNFSKGDTISVMKAQKISLSQIASDIADSLGLSLNFEASNKFIENYNYTGNKLGQVDLLGQMGNINAFVDDDSLIVKESSLALSNITKIINSSTGMLGIPDVTERGLRVTFLLDNQTRVGGLLRVESEKYPAVNGDYVIYKLSFEIASRDTPFYYIAEAKRLV